MDNGAYLHGHHSYLESATPIRRVVLLSTTCFLFVASLAHLQQTASSHDEENNNSVGAILVKEIQHCDIDDYNKTGAPLAIAKRDLQDDDIHNGANCSL